ncbi:putative quinol monooxygenase [Gulosibacter faecalis]|jgi:quinol monooxygenase YgiN|uniref:Quinol monooxygenase n=1 Tax=Gulosibacter faecalis TaxID=272240 RepID=A0ABW5UZI9_9MICO|nr:putative quinol monooxygenase [Gulosibacter faecalis]
MTITTFATYDCAPGDREDVLRLLEPARIATEAEDGCEYFHVLLPHDEPDRILLIEGWRSEADLATHRTTSHFVDIVLGTIAPRVAQRSVVPCTAVASPTASGAGSAPSFPRQPQSTAP